MKTFLFPEKLVLMAVLVLLTTLMSCTSVFFDYPQPVNSKNIESVPVEIQGYWTDASNYKESIKIDQTSFRKTSTEQNQIYKPEADTSRHFRITDTEIYLLSENKDKGYPYRLSNDTIYYDQYHEETFVLSDSVLLRRAKNCYVLNTRKNNWWEIFFIRKNKNGEISISYPLSADLIELKSKFNLMVLDSTREDTVRFHADFKSGNIEKILNKDGEGLLWTLNPDSTFRTNQ